MSAATGKSRGHAVVQEAFRKFEEALRGNDARFFKSTTLADVRDACKIIERDQGQRKCLRNMRRVEPLLDSLGKFGGAIETLCQGTPFLCFIWAPVKLLLQIADEYSEAFDRLLDAYHDIALHLPRFDRLREAFEDREELQDVLAGIYCDILEFHSHAYAYLRRNGWKCLFDASWRSFSGRFNSILQRLVKGRDLIDREAQSYAILEARVFRQKVVEELERSEKDRADWQLRDTFAWLDLKGQDREQQDLFESRLAARKDGTCEWILNNSKVRSWLDPEDARSVLWLRGKPGAGKTTIATYITEHAPVPPNGTTLYCLCSYGFARSESSVSSLTFRSLVSQLIRKDRSLLPHVYDNFVKTGVVPTTLKTKDLLRDLLQACDPTFVIIDGLDECDGVHQRELISDLIALSNPRKNTSREPSGIRILFCSRETTDILAKLRKSPQVHLTEERTHVSRDVALFAKEGLSPLNDQFSTALVEEIEQEVVKKADGMFLWVRLVLDMLLEQHSIFDLKNTLHELPAGLPGVYASILKRLQTCRSDLQIRRVRHILGWLAFSYRPLKTWEICDAIVLQDKHCILDDSTRLDKSILDSCKPLLEEREDQTVMLVHFSAREFLLQDQSGPYLPQRLMHINITQACIKYLQTCIPFTEERLTPITHGHIVKGFHDLFPYVNQYWSLHLIESFKSTPRNSTNEEIDAGNQTYRPLLDLFSAMKRSEMCQGVQESREDDAQQPTSHSQPVKLRDMPECVHRYLTFKKSAVGKTELPLSPSSAGTEPILEDPTLLTEAFHRYQLAFEHMLVGNSQSTLADMRISQNDFISFQERHRSSAYLCRFNGCVWTSIGFASPSERSKHEARHEARFRCSIPSCDFAIQGFISRQALRSHNVTYHTSVDDIVLPKFPVTKTSVNNSIKGSSSRSVSQSSERPPDDQPANQRPFIDWPVSSLRLSHIDEVQAIPPADWLTKHYDDEHVNGLSQGLTPPIRPEQSESPFIPQSLQPSPPTQADRLDQLQQRQHSFRCVECQWRGKTKSELQKHIGLHKKIFTCDVDDCKAKLIGYSRNDLERHLKAVHWINNRHVMGYKCSGQDCPEAEKIWPRLDNLKQHFSNSHKYENFDRLLQLSMLMPSMSPYTSAPPPSPSQDIANDQDIFPPESNDEGRTPDVSMDNSAHSSFWRFHMRNPSLLDPKATYFSYDPLQNISRARKLGLPKMPPGGDRVSPERSKSPWPWKVEKSRATAASYKGS